MKSNAERQKAYRERKKAEKAAMKDMQATMPPAVEEDLQAKIDPAPESAMQSPSVMELMEGQERYREELQQQPVIERQVPPPCAVEGCPDDLPPVKIEPETITYFDVYKRRHEGMFK